MYLELKQGIKTFHIMMNEECKSLSLSELEIGREAVRQTVVEKIETFVRSSKKSDLFNY